MPQYTFFCKLCALQFKRRLSMGDHEAHACPECSNDAERKWDGQPLSHNFAPGAGTARANSGVSQHDYPTADNIVGRSAEMRWAEQHHRNSAKAKVRGQGVALARKDISEGGQMVSEYTAMDKSRFDARKKLEGKFKTEAKKRGLSEALPKG